MVNKINIIKNLFKDFALNFKLYLAYPLSVCLKHVWMVHTLNFLLVL